MNIVIASTRHRHQRRRGVAALRRPERRHAVRDRLDAGHRRAAVRERRQQHEGRQQAAWPMAGCASSCGGAMRAGEIPPRADREHREDADDEEVGGHREDPARLANAAQVADHDQDATKPSAISTRYGTPLRERRRERRDAGGDADRDGQHVVDEQRRRRDQAGHACRGCPWRRCRRRRRSDTRESSGGTRRRRPPASTAMTDADRRDEAERRDAADEQHAQNFLGRVGHRRERVGREHREPGHARQPFVVGEMRGMGAPTSTRLSWEETIRRHGHPPIADGVS